ncbi:hypothetical protein BH721_00420 [Clostridium baratii]|uniref:hypothetical protein n=1 Tax=Clostridium baratii TaxID=1561 RepID=UPI0009A28877|nr:hypothetical protein [Clostridium baratii]OPF50994.1 hypothetical protein A1M12_05895 [Clostridium baratii]OPF53907.1 hypothetical protein BH724_02975 [Clostridium baratii]OPF58015.1 hypothetical protein BH721_00420 [Clostridium baratii]OPF61504.1 hypothetical protein BH725_12320 [Clostridium baratii]
MNKNKLIICIAIVITMLFPGELITKAYAQGKTLIRCFKDSDNVTNKFNVTNIDVNINEEFKEPSNWDGSVNEKLVKVQNNSTGPALMRISIQKRWGDSNGDTWAGNTNFIKLNFSSNADNLWIYGKDGYFYYNKVLAKNEFTKPILDSVNLNIPDELKKIYIGKKVIIDVDVEAVQATVDGYTSTWRNLNSDIKTMLDNLCGRK